MTSGILQEVIVTASKRSEPLQEVPAAVSALSGETLREAGAISFTDYARSIPSLVFRDNGIGRETPVLRGLNASGGVSTVGYYVGETPIVGGSSTAINPELIDIDRIEVLRGPQGTLYGAQSIGGTIKFIPKAPNLSKIEGEVQATGVSIDGNRRGTGGYGDVVLNLPIVSDVAAIRGVLWGRDVDGFIDRTYGHFRNTNGAFPVGTGSRVPTEHTWGFRGTALVHPADNLDITAMAFLQDQRFNGWEDITGGSTNPNDRLVQNLTLDTPEPQRNKFSLYSLTINYGFDRFNLVSNTAYIEQRASTSMEATSALQVIFNAAFPTNATTQNNSYTFTHETRLATSERIFGFDGVVGVFYSQARKTSGFQWSPSQYNVIVAHNDPTNPNYYAGNDLFGANDEGYEKQTAEFGELTYHFTDALKLTAGLRHYVISNGNIDIQSGAFAGAAPGTTIPHDINGLSGGWAHKGNLSYQITDDHLVYAQYAEGFRPGSGNEAPPSGCGAITTPTQVEPDSIKSYELGAKTQWLNKRLTANLALYQIDWNNIQQSVALSCGFQYSSNFGDAKVKGAELEVNDRLTDRMSVGLSGSYNRARLLTSSIANNSISEGVAGAKAGDQIEGVPLWQYALYGMSTFPILQTDDGYARVDYQYTGSSFATFARLNKGAGPRDPQNELKVIRLLNLRTGIKFGAWDFSLAGTNLLNWVTRQSIDPNSGVTIAIPGRPRYVVNKPRTFLLSALYKF